MLITAAALAVVGAAPALSEAHHPAPSPDAVESSRSNGAVAPRGVERVLGGDARARADGLFRVGAREGGPLLTHGPDSAGDLDAGGLAARAATAVSERELACGSDYYQHVLYVREAGAADRYAEARPAIEAVMREANAALNASSLASSGGTADYKVLCDGAGQMQVDRVVSAGTRTMQIITAIARAEDEGEPAHHVVFFDGELGDVEGWCGIATTSRDERLETENLNNIGGHYAIVASGCWDAGTLMHEIGHAQGAVQAGAPHSTGDGHSWQAWNVMGYSPDGGEPHQAGTAERCPAGLHFDCGADDYFDTAPEPGEYLASHWNLGSPLNRFLEFGPRPDPEGEAPGESPPANPTPPGAAHGSGSGEGPPGAQPPAVTEDASQGGAPIERLRASRARRDRAAAAGGWRDYWLRVPRRKRALKLVLTQKAADAELTLYVRRGERPRRTRDACHATRRGARETCRIRRPRRGTWYVAVHTRSGDGGAAFRLKAKY